MQARFALFPCSVTYFRLRPCLRYDILDSELWERGLLHLILSELNEDRPVLYIFSAITHPALAPTLTVPLHPTPAIFDLERIMVSPGRLIMAEVVHLRFFMRCQHDEPTGLCAQLPKQSKQFGGRLDEM
jgi:hypothetical protein